MDDLLKAYVRLSDDCRELAQVLALNPNVEYWHWRELENLRSKLRQLEAEGLE